MNNPVAPVVLISVFVLIPCGALLWRDIPLRRRGLTAEGTCVAVHHNLSSAKPSVRCEFEFTTAAGQVARMRTTPHNRPLAAVGETRTVHYLPRKPEKARIAQDFSIGGAVFGLVVGMAVIALTVFLR
ncbi:DUF3592 domain-containing protein [Streptomyces sp. UH6]|uniref:DUF3592 domain-containing protein n=1 Tax=Streptomyces sp. UH6 TaxID=2748379 RepID=UPI0015D47989|nr:DUF3592 domain-containing protein [Streptomyces sp. UH6]NYV73064.1 DUF3592 domain-containing protein [Streptomyces sp. UH6]